MKLSPPAARSAAIVASLCSLLLLAFFVRYEFFLLTGAGNYLPWARDNYFSGITEGYLNGLADIVHLRSWSVPAYPPGYSLVLAALSVFGSSIAALRLSQATVDCLAILPLYFVAFRLSGSAVAALLVCIAYALAVVPAFGAVVLLAESLSPFIMASILALMLLVRNGGARRWASLGVLCAFAALIRPDFLLMPIPLALWWFFVSRRLKTALAFVAALATPLLLWGIYSYVSTGYFTISSQGGAYALWAGLGELPNHFGYVMDDKLAGELAQRECPACFAHGTFFSPPVQYLFLQKYLAAWFDRPGYVMQTILHRIVEIPFHFSISHRFGIGLTPIELYCERIGFWLLVGTLVLLCASRRLAAAFVISLPFIYAVGSIGITHYEARYVGYVLLSYLIAPAVLVDLIPTPSRSFVACVVGVPMLAYASVELPDLMRKGHFLPERISAAVTAGHARKLADLSTIKWTKLDASGEIVRSVHGLNYVTSGPATAYQLSALPDLPAGAISIRYRGTLREGGIGIGILSPDRSFWLAMKQLRPGGNNDEFDTFLLKGGTLYIVNAGAAPGRSRFDLEALDIFVTTVQ